MVHAFVMIKTAAGKSEGLLASIRTLGPVSDAHIVAGTYDIIAEIDVAEMYDVLNAVSTEIQGLEGVTDTKTYVAMS